MSKTTAVSIKSQTDTSVTLAGYGVIFGGVDLDGETFGPDTDYMPDLVPQKLVFYDHAQGQVGHILGKTATVEPDEFGLWVEAELDRNTAYVEQVMTLAEKGALGWSSGTVAHLAQRAGKSITRWPIVEFSLTPTPAEPRTLGVDVIKSMARIDPSFGAFLPEDARTASVQDASDKPVAAKSDTEHFQQEKPIMAEETTGTGVNLADVLAVTKSLAESVKTIGERLERIEDAPAAKSAGHLVEVVEDETDKKVRAGAFPSFGDFLQSVKAAAEGNISKTMLALRSTDPANEAGFSIGGAMGPRFVGSLGDAAAKSYKAAPTGLGESLPQTGGVLVGSDRSTSIMERTYATGQLLQRVAMDTVGPNSNGMTYFAENETSRADGSRSGGLMFYWNAENSAVTASAATFREMELKLKKANVAIYVTDEQLQDTSAIESYINRKLPQELRYGVENSIINGEGVGKPLGVLNTGALVSVAKEAGQLAATIVSENISKMWSRRWVGGGSDYIWLYNQDIEPQLDNLNIAVGTAGSLVYMPPGGLSGAPYGTIKGRPAIAVEYAKTLGTVGDIMLVDLSQYQMIDKGGIQAAESIYVRFLEGEKVFKFTYRVDGQPMWSTALTPANGSNTTSPFVALATRA